MIKLIVMARYGEHSGERMTAEATNLQDEKQDTCIATGRPRATSVFQNTQASDPYPPQNTQIAVLSDAYRCQIPDPRRASCIEPRCAVAPSLLPVQVSAV
jgi:2-C-methyl-D-erythritol 4-phosphate cytidylyltransferase